MIIDQPNFRAETLSGKVEELQRYVIQLVNQLQMMQDSKEGSKNGL